MNELKMKIMRKLKRGWRDKRNLPFRLNKSFRRFLISHSANSRPSSYPYISGDTFRNMAQHIYDESSEVKYSGVKESDIVFVRTDYIEKFFKEVHPLIRNKYKLITHNDDSPITNNLVGHIDDKIIHWYGQNVDVTHPKITAIPIGLENMHYYNNGIISNIKMIQHRKINKKNRILFGFNIATNPSERIPAHNVLTNIEITDELFGWPNPRSYLDTLNSYKFVASPPGNGMDCTRTWEAMYVGTIPIIKESILTRYYHNIGLPVFVIKNWGELFALNEKKLQDIYENISPRFASPILYFDYWKNIITSHD